MFYLILGMRAEWILTDEERMNKRRKIEENRRLRQTIYPDSPVYNEVKSSFSITKNNFYLHFIFYFPSYILNLHHQSIKLAKFLLI